MIVGSVPQPDRPYPDRPDTDLDEYRRPESPSSGLWSEHAVSFDPNLYVIVLIDLVGSASAHGQAQRRIRKALYDLVDGALHRRGLGLVSFAVDDAGDGLRLFIPFHQVRPADVVDMFVLGLLAELRQHRRYTKEAARVRMRVAFDLGLVEPHLQGWIGDPLVRVARLIDAEPMRAVLRANRRLDLAVVVSDIMFRSVVRPGEGYIASDCFRPIDVTVKEYRARAWLLTPQAFWMCGYCGEAA